MKQNPKKSNIFKEYKIQQHTKKIIKQNKNIELKKNRFKIKMNENEI